jgi:transcriptional regulator with XRE-family HTH domain
MDIGKRFMDVFAYSGLSRIEFAERLKISPAVLSHISSGRNQPSLDLILALRRAYPEISLDWLLLGTGSMKRGQTDAQSLSSKPIDIEKPTPMRLAAPEPPAPFLQQECIPNTHEKKITDVNNTQHLSIPTVNQHKESILALRIALQMHQQWMEQQLNKLENDLKGEE